MLNHQNVIKLRYSFLTKEQEKVTLLYLNLIIFEFLLSFFVFFFVKRKKIELNQKNNYSLIIFFYTYIYI
jgi:hypothetical protein